MALPELLANSPVPGTREPVATLTAELKNEAGALTLELSGELPAVLHGPGQTRLTIDHEVVLVTAASGTKITVLERAAEGSTKAAHSVGASVYALPTREGLLLAMADAGPWKRPVAWATTGALPAVTAEGELLKSTGKEVLKVDGGEPAVGARVLVKDQAATKDNGIYEVVKKGAAGTEIFELKRVADANGTAELQDAVTVVEKGTANEGSTWTQIATVTTVGTTAQVWVGLGASAWSALVLGAKVEAGALQTPGVRREGVTARLRGLPKIKAGEELKVGETLATVPAGMRPPAAVQLSATSGAVGPIPILVATTGIITVGVSIAVGNAAPLDGLTYNLT
jgi:hypothetical protein